MLAAYVLISSPELRTCPKFGGVFGCPPALTALASLRPRGSGSSAIGGGNSGTALGVLRSTGGGSTGGLLGALWALTAAADAFVSAFDLFGVSTLATGLLLLAFAAVCAGMAFVVHSGPACTSAFSLLALSASRSWLPHVTGKGP